MKIELLTYALEFKKPFHLAGKSYTTREGCLFRLHAPEGVFTGDAAPLPGFSDESKDDVIEAARAFTKWKALFESDYTPQHVSGLPASLQFALSSVWYMRKARTQNDTLQHYLYHGAHKKLSVNLAVGMGSTDDALKQLESGTDAGFNTFKFKVGADMEAEHQTLKAVREFRPDIRIRIDANGAWEPEQALDALQIFAPLDIEYCEQPLPPGDDEASAWLKSQTPVPIAADESVRNYEQARRIILNELADFLIIKPMLIGSVDAYRDIIKMAQMHEMNTVVTTSLESGAGRRITAKLASLIPVSRHAHGLATGKLFVSDPFPDDHLIENGMYSIAEIEDEPELKHQPELVDVFSF